MVRMEVMGGGRDYKGFIVLEQFEQHQFVSRSDILLVFFSLEVNCDLI